MRTTLLAAFVLALSAAILAQNPHEAPAKQKAASKHKAVFQMNVADNDSWDDLIGNIVNMQAAFRKDGVQIEVVFFAKGVTALLKTNSWYEDRLKKVAADGVILAVCQNSMRAKKITSQDLFPFATEVDSGVAELVRKQEAGWSYIRAGQ